MKIPKPKIVPNWRDSYKWLSMHAAALIVAWSLTPADVQTAMLAIFGWPADRVTALLGLLAIIGRVVDQSKAKP